MTIQIPLIELPEQEIELYRPSNGTEGDLFNMRFCYRCARFFNNCQIELLTMAYDTSDPEYPREWRYVNGKPVCVKFEDGEG